MLTVEIDALAKYIVVVCPPLALRDVNFIVKTWVMNREFLWIHSDDWA